MLRALTIGVCCAVLTVAVLAACVHTGHHKADKATNTALTGACLAADLPPCTIEASPQEKTQAQEAKAAATRAQAQQSSQAATKDAIARSSCLTDTGPRVPVSSGQCAAYQQSP